MYFSTKYTKYTKYISTNIKTSLNTVAIAVDSIKNIGTKGALFDEATLIAYKQQLEGLTITQQKMALMTTNLTAAQREQVLSYIASTTATKTLTAEQVLSCTADEKRILVKAGLIAEEELEKGAVINLTQEKLKEILVDETLNATEKNTILTKFGVTGANLTEASSWEVLGKSIGKATIAMMKWLFLTPAGRATLAIGAVVGLIGAYAKWGPTLENTREKLENLKSECETLASDLSSVNSELETTKQRINELEGKESLTFVEAEELENLKKQNNELERTIDLLELEQKTKNKEKNKTFVDTMEKDVYSTDYYKDGLDGGKIKKGQAGRSEHRTTTTEQAYIIQQFNDREKLLDDLTNAETEAERQRIQEQIDKIDKYLSDRNDQFKSDAEGIDYIQNPTNEDDKKVNEWLDYINDFQDKMAIAMGGDNAKENAFNRLVDNWKFDELLNPLQKLGKEGKVTLDDLKSRMSDPVFSEFVNKLVEIGFISDTTDGSLRYLANAFNGTATSARNYVTALKGNDLNNFIDNLGEEAKALGTTESELAKLTAAHVIFNNTGLSTEQQQRALQALAQKIATTSSEMKYLLRLFNIASMDSVDELVAQGRTRHEALRQQANVRKYLKDKYGIDLSPIEIPEKEDIVPYTPPGDKDKGKDNAPDYEDPTDAIINRINLRAKELEQQEESIQNAIEIAELENDYKKQILSVSRLISNRKKQIKELNTANDALHNEAEYLRNSYAVYDKYGKESDENTWFDSMGNATEAYKTLLNNTATKEEKEAIEDLFEKLSKYKKAYVENAEEITNLNKQILQSEEDIWDIRHEIFDARMEDSEYYIQHSKDFGWENGDSEVEARKRVLDWIKSDYYKSLIKDDEEYYKILEENRLKYIEAQKDAMEKSISDIEDYIDARNHYNDWDAFGDSELKAIQRQTQIIEDAYEQRLLTADEYVKRLEEYSQRIYSLAQEQINDSLSDIDRYIDERNHYDDWDIRGDSEIDAIKRKQKIIDVAYSKNLMSLKEYTEKTSEFNQRIYSIEQEYINKSIENIDRYIDARNRYDDWDSYNDSEIDAVKRQCKIIEDAYSQNLMSLDEYTQKSEEYAQKLYSLGQKYIDESLSEIDRYIDTRNTYDDWDEWGDSEVEAIKKQIEILDKAYKEKLTSLEDYTQKVDEYHKKLYSVSKNNIIETISKMIEDYEEMRQDEKEGLSFESTQYSSLATLLQSHYDVVNAISEAQHEINKELRDSKSMYEYLNKETRKLLFNQEDYDVLNEKLLDIQAEANRLQEEYNEKILNASKENIAEITSEYQMQYELLMKQYEISKAELDVEKKKQKLNNVLAERNVRMFIDGEWQWVADTQKVIEAENELADAEIEREQRETSLKQIDSINNLTKAQNDITTQINNLETDLEKVRESWSDMQKMLNGESHEVAEVLKQISQVASPELKSVIEATGNDITSFSSSLSESIDAMTTVINTNLDTATSDILENVGADISDITTTISDNIDTINTNVATSLENITSSVSTGINNINTTVSQGLTDYSEAIKDLVEKINNIEIKETEDEDEEEEKTTSGGSYVKQLSANEQKAIADGYTVDAHGNVWSVDKSGKETFVASSADKLYSSSGNGSSSSGGSKGSSSGTSSTGSSTNKAPQTINTTDRYIKQNGQWMSNPNYKHADGTRYTPGGLTALGEEGFEAYIDNNGHLIPIKQPTIGNIGAGGVVFNQAQMENLRSLWDLSNMNKILPHISNIADNKPNMITDNSIHIDGLVVGEQGNEDWINGLRRYVATHR